MKILVYRDGGLVEPPEGASPTRAEVKDKERAYSSIEADRYATEAPKPPAKDEEPKDDEPKKGAGEAAPKDADADK